MAGLSPKQPSRQHTLARNLGAESAAAQRRKPFATRMYLAAIKRPEFRALRGMAALGKGQLRPHREPVDASLSR